MDVDHDDYGSNRADMVADVVADGMVGVDPDVPLCIGQSGQNRSEGEMFNSYWC